MNLLQDDDDNDAPQGTFEERLAYMIDEEEDMFDNDIRHDTFTIILY